MDDRSIDKWGCNQLIVQVTIDRYRNMQQVQG